MKYCKRCVQPDTRPGIFFDKEGVCGACLYTDAVKHGINWEEREKELKEITEWAKSVKKGAYDCLVGVSGGKDSTFQALYARDKLGLHPLLVNCEPDGISEIGRYNIENLINLGFDTIRVRANPIVVRKLIKRDFYRYLNPVKITEYTLWASTFLMASAFKIPLVIHGENPALTLGARNTKLTSDGNALNACDMDTVSKSWKEYIGDGVREEDLFLFHYDKEELKRAGIKAIWLQYYAKEWSQSANYKFARAHGLKDRSDLGFNPNDIGSYVPYFQLDTDTLHHVNQMHKYVKFGFGQCTDHACYDIRDGIITRQKGIELVREYDGKCSEKYIRMFCDYVGVPMDEYWKVVNSFRGKMWEKDKIGGWKLNNPIWEQEGY